MNLGAGIHFSGPGASGGGTAPLDVVTVSGAGTTSSNGSYTRNGNAGGRAAYASGANTLGWNGSEWELYDDVAGLVTYISFDDVSAPWLASTWVEADGDSPAPTVGQATGTLAEALAAKADRDDLLSKANQSDLDLKANDADVLKLTGTQSASAVVTWSGRQQFTGQPALPAASDGMSRDAVEANRWIASPLYRDLFVGDRVTAGTGVTGAGNYAVEGRSGGFITAGDSTSTIYCPGASTLTGYSVGGNNISWAYAWWFYCQFEVAITTNALMRIAVGLRTDTTSDISTVSGSFAGIEWSSSTSVRGFGASGSTPTVGSPVTSSTVANVRNHVWMRNNANGSVTVYHATGFSPRLPSSALLTISGAPTGNGGAGFELLLKGTGASAAGAFQSFNARLLVP